MIGVRTAGAFVTSLIGAVVGLVGKGEPVSPPPALPWYERATVNSAYYGRRGGSTRSRRALRQAIANKSTRTLNQKIARDVAHDKHRAPPKPPVRTATGLLAFPR